jgi:anti-repressor protein
LEEIGYFARSGDSVKPNSSTDTFIPENFFYRLAMKAKNETAEKFQALVADEILPSIRKHGAYITPDTIDKMISNPEFGIKLLTALQEEKYKRIAAEIRINEMKPKELFADSVTASKDSVLVAGLSAILKQNGIDIGEMRLWEWLRNRGYAIREKGRSWNMPTQRSLDLKVMEVKEGTRIDAEGSSKITKTTMITGKGQVYFVNKFLSREESA